jgi:hypothetical protein
MFINLSKILYRVIFGWHNVVSAFVIKHVMKICFSPSYSSKYMLMLQVGPIFFKTPRKCEVFGECCEGSGKVFIKYYTVICLVTVSFLPQYVLLN